MIALCLATAVSVTAQVPKGPDAEPKSDQHPNTRQQETETNPPISNQEPETKSKENIANGTPNGPLPSDPIKVTDWIMAISALFTLFFTIGLTVSTYLLWRETQRLAKGAEAQAKDFKASLAHTESLANATMKSSELAERTYINTYRPVLILRAIKARLLPEEWTKPQEDKFAIVEFENAGTQPAIIEECEFSFSIVGKGAPYPVPLHGADRWDLADDDVSFPTPTVINPQGKHAFTINWHRVLTEDQFNSIAAFNDKIFVTGFANYRDPPGIVRQLGFVLVLWFTKPISEQELFALGGKESQYDRIIERRDLGEVANQVTPPKPDPPGS